MRSLSARLDRLEARESLRREQLHAQATDPAEAALLKRMEDPVELAELMCLFAEVDPEGFLEIQALAQAEQEEGDEECDRTTAD
jgi:hypothetical protein